MAKFHRMISLKAKGYWRNYAPKFPEFITNDDFFADLLLNFSDSNLSFWKVDGDAKKVWFALAFENPEEDACFLTFDESVISSSKLKLIDKDGKTADDTINKAGYHKEIIDLTAKEVIDLILKIIKSQPTVEILKKAEIKAELKSRITSPAPSTRTQAGTDIEGPQPPMMHPDNAELLEGSVVEQSTIISESTNAT